MHAILAAALAVCTTLSLDVPRHWPVPGGVTHVFTEDLNGDGVRDLTITSAFPKTQTTIRYGRRGGTFSDPPVTMALDVVAVADVIGDALPDLVVREVGVMKNDGDGTFTLVPLSQTYDYRSIVADFTGDGRNDILTQHLGNDVYVVLHVATGEGFVAQPPSVVTNYDVNLIAGDVTGDGHLDLIGAHRGSGEYRVFAGNGRGAFAPLLTTRLAESLGPSAAGDLDGDGRADLVFGLFEKMTVVYGKGGATSIALPQRTSSDNLVVRDLDGDGDDDVIARVVGETNERTVTVLINDGGVLRQGQSLNFAAFYRLAAEDLTGDGIVDLIVTATGAVVLPGRGDGTFRVPPKLDVVPEGRGHVVGDVDRDGVDEIVFEMLDRRVAIAFGERIETLPVTTAGYVSLQVAANGEVLVYDPQRNSSALFTRNAEGTWALTRTFTAGAFGAVADVTGDGRNDLIFTTATALRVDDGERIVLDQALEPGHMHYLLAEDVTNDGKVDIVLTLSGTQKPQVPWIEPEANGRVLLFAGRGDGTFTAPKTILENVPLQKTVAGDFNGDGRTDLGIRPPGEAFRLAYGAGNGAFVEPVALETNVPFFSEYTAADLNRDGITDIVTSGTDALTYFLGSRNGLTGFGNWSAGRFRGDPLVARLRPNTLPTILLGGTEPLLTRVDVGCVGARRRGVRH